MLKFSVLLSIYKKEEPMHFRLSLDSILNQTLLPAEIIVVKDGKLSANLDDICVEYNIKYTNLFKFVLLEKNQGLGKALQVGLQYCSYDIIARMDTDDIAKPDRFEKQIREFQKDDLLVILGTTIEEFSTTPERIDSIRKVPLSNQEIRQYAKMRNPFNHMTVMFKKSAVLDVGNYQPFYLCEDYYLWYRLLNKGYKAKNLSESLVYARVDKNMFQRRGGIKYFLQEVKLQNIFYRNHFINTFEYIRNIGIRMIARLIPNAIRGILYRKCMRK
ncbi:glycosyltransferase [Anaerosinus massiliensis]|uniref:glycosyltransferase n=1 Tax=Massilibacillus massiliensis TaxID=1806837 RepID=UPI000A45383F|nr:glycosyltransferase [Massilibacillus massiliensis]